MKRIISLVLCCLMLVGMLSLSACGKKSEDAGLTVAVVVIAMLAATLAVRKKLNFGKMGMSAVVLSAIFTTVYFILGCVAFSEATAYGGEGYGYSAHTFAFIPFALMIILVGAFILVKVKLPKNYKIVLKKRNK